MEQMVSKTFLKVMGFAGSMFLTIFSGISAMLSLDLSGRIDRGGRPLHSGCKRSMRIHRMDYVVSQEGYSRMSCSVCAGYDSYNCPCCGEDARMMECPDCEGTGAIYYAFHITERRFKQVTELAYTILPPDEDDARRMRGKWCQGDIRRCPTCKGEGEI